MGAVIDRRRALATIPAVSIVCSACSYAGNIELNDDLRSMLYASTYRNGLEREERVLHWLESLVHRFPDDPTLREFLHPPQDERFWDTIYPTTRSVFPFAESLPEVKAAFAGNIEARDMLHKQSFGMPHRLRFVESRIAQFTAEITAIDPAALTCPNCRNGYLIVAPADWAWAEQVPSRRRVHWSLKRKQGKSSTL